MGRILPGIALLLAWCGAAPAAGLLIPEEKTVPPLAMLNHRVSIVLDDQVAVTKVEQTFRNHTDRQLEATYVFPVPKGAGVNKFTMVVDGKEVKGELLDAKQAQQVYTSIVRRTQDPGLLEYMGNDLFRLKVFPIKAHGDQKVTLSYTSVAQKEGGLVEYIYPLKTDGKATSTLEDFSIKATLKSQHAIQNVYSPTHAVDIKRTNDKEVEINFQRSQALLDKDFQLFYSLGDKDVGLTAIMHRPVSSENGYFTLLIAPKVEMAKEYQIPRDMVMVLDTSGSMRGIKMDQAKKALKYCLGNLASKDRFALINFSTAVNKYKDGLLDASQDQIEQGKKWVDNLDATGGTAIDAALKEALDLRTSDMSRTFTIVFFTDGMPTVGETNWDKILKNVSGRNTANTRIFTFGVGDDVNATMLDTLAEQTRAVSTYVRPAEDIESKVSGLYSKISNPVLTNLKLTAGKDVSFLEVYPPQLPDLFHGGELVILGRYSGKGPAAITLTGAVGMEQRSFVYETSFPDKTNDGKDFVEHLWARRKVGYLLDQIRANGEKKELVEEVTSLAKKYGITTPYTSYLIVPDGPMPVVRGGADRLGAANEHYGLGGGGAGYVPPGLKASAGFPGGGAKPVAEYAKEAKAKDGDLGKARGNRADDEFARSAANKSENGATRKLSDEASDKKRAYDRAQQLFRERDKEGVQSGKLGVDLSVQTNNLRNQNRIEATASRNVAGRNLIELGGVWIDDGFDAKMTTITIKAQSDAYFRLLELQPQIKEVLRLGNHLVWVTPNGTALVIDTTEGKEKMTDEELKKLFDAKK
ncbi:MAG: VIT domain-containing protein [Gemmataceae bacterium]